MYKIKKVRKVKCRFKTDDLFNQEFIDFMKIHSGLRELQLWEDEKLVVSIPYEKIPGNRYEFFCGAYPYVKPEWFCEDTKYLAKLNMLMLKSGTPLEIVNIISEKKEKSFLEDYGLAIIKTVPKEEVPNLYEGRFKKNIKRTIRLTKDLEYRPLDNLEDAEELLEYWFEIFENPTLDLFEKQFELWQRNKKLYLNGIFKKNKLIGADYIYIGEIGGEKIACAILKPWYKTEENLKFEIGKFGTIERLDFLNKKGIKKVSLGDRFYSHKMDWETEVYPTYSLGTGAWKSEFQ